MKTINIWNTIDSSRQNKSIQFMKIVSIYIDLFIKPG